MTEQREPALRVLSLGAGVQSTALLLMALHGEFDHKPDCAIFADTGWEPKAVYEHLAWLERESTGGGIPVRRVSIGNIRDDVVRVIETQDTRVGNSGQPPLFVHGPLDPSGEGGRLWRKCTAEYKIEPIKKEIRSMLGIGKGKRVPKGVVVEQWMGISWDERQRTRSPRDPWVVNVYPLVDRRITRDGCVAWLAVHEYPTPPKSSCIGCPYHSNKTWREMKRDRPDEFEDACRWDEQIRHGLPGVRGDAYLHRAMIPLRQVDLRNEEDRNGQTLFGDGDFGAECEGHCGV